MAGSEETSHRQHRRDQEGRSASLPSKYFVVPRALEVKNVHDTVRKNNGSSEFRRTLYGLALYSVANDTLLPREPPRAEPRRRQFVAKNNVVTRGARSSADTLSYTTVRECGTEFHGDGVPATDTNALEKLANQSCTSDTTALKFSKSLSIASCRPLRDSSFEGDRHACTHRRIHTQCRWNEHFGQAAEGSHVD